MFLSPKRNVSNNSLTQGTPLGEQGECRSQRDGGPQDEHSESWWSRTPSMLTVCTGLHQGLCTHCCPQFSVFMEFVRVWTSGSLVLVPSIRLFSSVLSNSDVGVSVIAFSGSREEGIGRVRVRKALIKIYYVRGKTSIFNNRRKRIHHVLSN